ncbi:MAG TPA: PRC-barrel domain-containing protein [Terriglobales bacterium]|nr:PRC-barrel domain-containing protein [Terriglobales bacterium]
MLKRLRDTEFADRASDIRGADLYGSNNDKIGTINDVIFEADTSTATYAIVDTGGWLKSRRFLVPSDSIRSKTDDPDAFFVPLTRQQIEELPQFDEEFLNSEERFVDYEARYRPVWKAYGFDVPTSRHGRIQQFENQLRERRAQTQVTPMPATKGATGGVVSVYGVYHDQGKLESAVDRLKSAGFDSNDISVVFPDKNRSSQFAMERNTKAPEGATAGGGTGMVVGGVLGWLAGIGSLAIPGIGPLIAAGPIVAALAGAGVGGAVGGLAGALVGLGMPELEAKRYEKEIKEGRMLLSVRCSDPRFSGTARSILAQTNARDIFETGERKAA